MDINYFRVETGKIDVMKESQRRRGKPAEEVDEVTALDNVWRRARFELNELQKAINDNGLACGKEKDPEKKKELIAHGKELKLKLPILKEREQKALEERDEKLYAIGNLVHDSVPVSMEEKDNALVKYWNKEECRKNDGSLKHHHELLFMIGGYQPEIGADVAGHRGYYLTGPGMLLNNALVQYGLHFLTKKGYQPVQVPYFMKQSTMKKVAALAEFNEALYKVTGNEEDEPAYLIATSEQPICALNMNQTFSKKDLPIKYAGSSTCFRKEAGKHGKDAWGVFRVHQFEKIEQFVVCEPDKSWEMQQEMLDISEEFYQSLQLPYQVVNIVSGDLNNAAARKYDLEAWFPTLGCFRELVSCSNCTDYQSRRLNIKYAAGKKEGEGAVEHGQFVHLLNSTLCATERTLCCILENYQTEKGIRIPAALKPYLAPFLFDLKDPELIPFVNDGPLLGKGAKGQEKGIEAKQQKKQQQQQQQQKKPQNKKDQGEKKPEENKTEGK
jgi:seryl-tRNA synthetase